MNDMIEYFKTMITPPVEDACVLVAKPNEIDYPKYLKEVFEEGDMILPEYEPMVHGIILLSEPTKEEAKEIMKILKPGGHVVLIPENSIGHQGVIALEDGGLEVRDAIYVADNSEGFYYTSKASRSEREAGLRKPEGKSRANIHPTVKPLAVMEWCGRDLQKESKVVDPFMGSGTTGIAMSKLGHDFCGIELNPEYAEISEKRIRYWKPIDTKVVSENEEKEEETLGQVSLFDF